MELLNASMFLSHFSLGSLSRQEPMLPQMPTYIPISISNHPTWNCCWPKPHDWKGPPMNWN